MPAPQRALQILTATPAYLHLLQPLRRPQFSAYIFTFVSVLVARPSALALYTGLNAMPDRRSEEHYKTLLDTARKKTDARFVISGPLPTYRRGSERFSRLFALQSWLRGWCALNSLGYMDTWSSFREQPALYWRDGLHPSRLGSVVL
ncbi:hypothetical protein SRHO_G00238000 [Serrasalmus rhombeus]